MGDARIRDDVVSAAGDLDASHRLGFPRGCNGQRERSRKSAADYPSIFTRTAAHASAFFPFANRRTHRYPPESVPASRGGRTPLTQQNSEDEPHDTPLMGMQSGSHEANA